jgi:hypothetical protein
MQLHVPAPLLAQAGAAVVAQAHRAFGGNDSRSAQ